MVQILLGVITIRAQIPLLIANIVKFAGEFVGEKGFFLGEFAEGVGYLDLADGAGLCILDVAKYRRWQ